MVYFNLYLHYLHRKSSSFQWEHSVVQSRANDLSILSEFRENRSKGSNSKQLYRANKA